FEYPDDGMVGKRHHAKVRCHVFAFFFFAELSMVTTAMDRPVAVRINAPFAPLVEVGFRDLGGLVVPWVFVVLTRPTLWQGQLGRIIEGVPWFRDQIGRVGIREAGPEKKWLIRIFAVL